MLLNNFKQKLINDINTSGLSIDAIYYVMRDLMRDVIDQYNLALQQEVAAAAQSNEPAESEDSKTEAVAETKEKEE